MEFENGGLSPDKQRSVAKHIGECDFCSAEVELYHDYPQIDETVSPTEIPAPLFELAESLLNNRHKDSSFLNKLLIEDPGLTLNEA
ncbi:MAG: hypothetical protein R2681_12005 [Pyrinomonadaceae bacterium]